MVVSKRRARKRKRKIILPKNFDPKVPPDPERWLPKQERTAFRKKLNKKHRDRDIGRGTQGAVSSSPKMCVFLNCYGLCNASPFFTSTLNAAVIVY